MSLRRVGRRASELTVSWASERRSDAKYGPPDDVTAPPKSHGRRSHGPPTDRTPPRTAPANVADAADAADSGVRVSVSTKAIEIIEQGRCGRCLRSIIMRNKERTK